MNYDFKPGRHQARHSQFRYFRPGWLLLAVLIGLCIFLALPDPTPPAESKSVASIEQAEIDTTIEPAAPPPPPPPPEPVRHEAPGVIQPGENITVLLGGWLTPQQIHQLNQQSKDIFPLNKLSAGQPYMVATLDEEFDRFVYEIDDREQFIIRRDSEGFDLERVEIPYETRVETIQGSIESSLFGAMAATGERAELTMRMADIFAWDIDFIRDLRTGDSFQLLVEKKYRDGIFATYGNILAAEFINRGDTHRAVYFKDGKQSADYYGPNGRSLRKAFLKAPLKFSRISSNFSYRRKHPVTGDYKPHLAIDYAAPRGTPVKAIGDGTVIVRGYDKYSGNKLKVRHPNGYVSVYIHLQKFAKKARRGKKVRQGQVIAYVGNTGRSTGPHLDFRMLKHGKPVNPLKIKSPAARPVSKEYRSAFNALAENLLSRFDSPIPANGEELRQAADSGAGHSLSQPGG